MFVAFNYDELRCLTPLYNKLFIFTLLIFLPRVHTSPVPPQDYDVEINIRASCRGCLRIRKNTHDCMYTCFRGEIIFFIFFFATDGGGLVMVSVEVNTFVQYGAYVYTLHYNF